MIVEWYAYMTKFQTPGTPEARTGKEGSYPRAARDTQSCGNSTSDF